MQMQIRYFHLTESLKIIDEIWPPQNDSTVIGFHTISIPTFRETRRWAVLVARLTPKHRDGTTNLQKGHHMV